MNGINDNDLEFFAEGLKHDNTINEIILSNVFQSKI